MARVSEIIRKLQQDGKEAVGNLVLDNFREVIQHPKIVDGADFIEYSPGILDVKAARFAVTVSGCTFVRSQEDAIWRPKDEDELIGILSFVGSRRFHESGYAVANADDRQECREVVLRIISDLIDGVDAFGRISELRYCDFGVAAGDFIEIRDQLLNFRYVGYYYDQGHWHGARRGAKIERKTVCATVCALALLEGFDAEKAEGHLIAKIADEDCKRLGGLLKKENGPLDLMLESYRSYLNDKGMNKKGIVSLLLSWQKVRALSEWLENGHDAERMEVSKNWQRLYTDCAVKWERACRKERKYMECCAAFAF